MSVTTVADTQDRHDHVEKEQERRTLDTMPVEVLLMIFSYLYLLDLRSLRLSYGRYIACVIRTHFRLPFEKYVRVLTYEGYPQWSHKNKTPFDEVAFEALSIAAAFGHLPLIDALITRNGGASRSERNTTEDKEHLIRSISPSNLPELRKHEMNRFISMPDYRNRTPLEWASKKGQNTTIGFLFERGARFTANHPLGVSLKYAAINGHTSTVRLLLAIGNRELSTTSYFRRGGRENMIQSSQFLAAFRHCTTAGNTEMMRLLFEHGSNALPVPLDYLHKRCRDCRKAKKRILESRDEPEKPLHLAAEKGHLEAVELLLSWGANIEAISATGYTALDYAASKGHKTVVQFLLRHGAAMENGGRSSLLAAVYGERFEIVQMLLDTGLYSEHNDLKNSALDVALVSRDFAMITLLLDSGAVLSAMNNGAQGILHEAGFFCDMDFIWRLLDLGVEIDGRWNGQTALQVACETNHCQAAVALLCRGACTSVLDPFNKGTPLHVAALRGFHEMAGLLLDFGADVDATGSQYDTTALHLAAMAGDTRMVKLLLKYGATIEQKDKEGRTALFFAVLGPHAPVVFLLLKRGATLTVDGEDMKLPLSSSIYSWIQEVHPIATNSTQGRSAEVFHVYAQHRRPHCLRKWLLTRIN